MDTLSTVIEDYSERIPYRGDDTITLDSCIGLAIRVIMNQDNFVMSSLSPSLSLSLCIFLPLPTQHIQELTGRCMLFEDDGVLLGESMD